MVGREREIGELTGLLKKPEIRLITLHGLGGTGKTRLAVETAQAAPDLFPDGVWFVPLASLSSPEHINSATAAALGFSFQSHEDQQGQLIRFLQTRQLLLIFDNLEHLLPEATGYLESVLRDVPDCRLLVTSRQPINAPWESVYPLHGLEYEASSSETNGETPAAAQLFLTQLSRVGGPAAGNDLGCALQICQLVNGLPLALLLAATWGRALECSEIAQEIQRGIGFLQTQQKTFPERQSSMQAVFDHSWRRLAEHERAVLRKLSIFQGTFDRGAAESVAGADLAILATLIDQSFVDRVSKDRYQIHELLRQYLQDRLVEAGEEKTVRNHHLGYYTRVAEQAEPELMGRQQKAWITRLQKDVDNIRTALDWVLASGEVPSLERGLRLIVATERFWALHTHVKEGHSYLTRILEQGKVGPTEGSFVRVYARGLNVAAKLSFLLEDLAATRRFAEEALQIGLELNDPRVIGDACFNQGNEARHRGELTTAHPLLERALENYRACGYWPGISRAIGALGRVDVYNNNLSSALSNLSTALDLARKQEDAWEIASTLRSLGQLGLRDPQIGLHRAREYYSEGLQYARQLDDKRYVAIVLVEMGELARLEGEFGQAAAIFEEADSTSSELGEIEGRIVPQLNLGFVYLRLGRYDESRQMFMSNLVRCQPEEHLKLELSFCLLGLAGLIVVEGKSQLAARILGAIESQKEQLVRWPTDRSEYDRVFSSVKVQLGEKQFHRSFREGQALSLADASQLVQSQAFKEKGRDVERLNQLTKRELEILRLVAQGMSDAQVAERLVLSPRTVNAHLTSVYRKIDVNSRAAATRFAIEHGLA
jgi:predicted ATPase/DNA-binding CsgD family transcriptional regulator